MQSKNSFQSDIESGFQILHIDPSIDIHNSLSTDEVLTRIFELYEFVGLTLKNKKKLFLKLEQRNKVEAQIHKKNLIIHLGR